MTNTNNIHGDKKMSRIPTFTECFEAICEIPSRAMCISGECVNNLPFIPLHEFAAMGFNFELEREQLNFELDLQAEQNAWYDELEAANRASDMMELGLTM